MSEKKKPRGKPFESQDARRNSNGQRNAAAVATAAHIRALYIEVLHETPGTPTKPESEMSYLEKMVRLQVIAAASGNSFAREMMLDRIFGKAPK